MQLNEKITDSKLSRRTVVKAGAWAVPVVAAAVAVPMAAASAKQAVLSAEAGGGIIANDAAGTATGTLNGGVRVSNVVGSAWETGALRGQYQRLGSWSTFAITKPDGTPFVANETIVVGSVVWTVVTANANSVVFTALSQPISADTVYPLPAAIFNGTFTPNTLDEFTKVQATVSVRSANINGGNSVGSSVFYPGSDGEDF